VPIGLILGVGSSGPMRGVRHNGPRMARSPAPSTCPLGPRLVIQPLLDPCHPAERHSGWRRATCPVLLTLAATRLIDVTADGQRTNQPSGLTGRLVNTSLRLFLDCTPFLRHIAQPAVRVRRALS
jgi:hypothetical protein